MKPLPYCPIGQYFYQSLDESFYYNRLEGQATKRYIFTEQEILDDPSYFAKNYYEWDQLGFLLKRKEWKKTNNPCGKISFSSIRPTYETNKVILDKNLPSCPKGEVFRLDINEEFFYNENWIDPNIKQYIFTRDEVMNNGEKFFCLPMKIDWGNAYNAYQEVQIQRELFERFIISHDRPIITAQQVQIDHVPELTIQNIRESYEALSRASRIITINRPNTPE